MTANASIQDAMLRPHLSIRIKQIIECKGLCLGHTQPVEKEMMMMVMIKG